MHIAFASVSKQLPPIVAGDRHINERAGGRRHMHRRELLGAAGVV